MKAHRKFMLGLLLAIVSILAITTFVIAQPAQAPAPGLMDGQVALQAPTPVVSAPGPTQAPVDFWSSLIQEILLAFLPVLAAFLVGLLITLIKFVLEKIKAARPDVYGQMIWVVSTAVKAAQQAGAAGFIEDKKQYALSYVQNWLTEKGFKIDVALIDAAIEAAVYEEIKKPGLLSSGVQTLPVIENKSATPQA